MCALDLAEDWITRDDWVPAVRISHSSCAGLTRASMRRFSLPNPPMDCRVKPGNDE
jgi:hypothetical protein